MKQILQNLANGQTELADIPCNVGMVMEVGAGGEGFQVGNRVVSNGKHAEVVNVPKNLCAKIPDGVSDEAAAFTVLGAIALQGIRLAHPTLGEAIVVTGLGLIGLLTVQLLRAQGCRVLGIDYDPAKLELARRFGAETVDLSKNQDPLAAAQAFSRGRGVDAVIITASTQSNEPVSQAAKMCRQGGRIVLVGITGLELSRADFYQKELTFQVSCSYGPGRYDPNYEEKGQDYPVGFVRWTEQRNFEAILDMLAGGALDVQPLISHRFPIDQAEAAYQLLGSDQPSLGILLEYPRPEEQPDEVLVRHVINLPLGKGEESYPGTTVAGSKSPPYQGGDLEGINQEAVNQAPVVGFIGAGNYAGRVLIPAFKKADAQLHTVASSGGVSGVHFGKKFGFTQATTDTAALLANLAINTVVIATQHHTHARFVCEALRAGKHVFVEKPLALTLEELEEIKEVYREMTPSDSPLPRGRTEIPPSPPLSKGGTEISLLEPRPSLLSPRTSSLSPFLMVGFNRRFAPQIQKIKTLLSGIQEPKTFIMTVNAGDITPDHWTQDPQVGGGGLSVRVVTSWTCCASWPGHPSPGYRPP